MLRVLEEIPSNLPAFAPIIIIDSSCSNVVVDIQANSTVDSTISSWDIWSDDSSEETCSSGDRYPSKLDIVESILELDSISMRFDGDVGEYMVGDVGEYMVGDVGRYMVREFVEYMESWEGSSVGLLDILSNSTIDAEISSWDIWWDVSSEETCTSEDRSKVN